VSCFWCSYPCCPNHRF